MEGKLDDDLLMITEDAAVAKRDIQSRGWLLTVKAEQWDQEAVEDLLGNYSYVGQLESGEGTGYLHWQIYIENANPIKFSTLKNKFPSGAWFGVRRGTKLQALTYVSKPDTFAGVKIRNGEMDMSESPGRRTDLDRYLSSLDDGMSVDQVILQDSKAIRYERHLRSYRLALDKKAAEAWRDVRVRYVWGETGVGKTRFVFEKYGADAFRITNYENPFDFYDGQRVLVMDEFRGQVDFDYLLNVLDGYPFQMRARYVDKVALFDEVWVLSNSPLDTYYQEQQRDHPNDWKALLRRFNGGIYSWDEAVSAGVVVPFDDEELRAA